MCGRNVDRSPTAEEMAEAQEKGDRLSEVEDAILVVLFEYDCSTKYILLKELTEKVQNIVPWVKDWHLVKSAFDNLSVAKTTRNKKRSFIPDQHRKS